MRKRRLSDWACCVTLFLPLMSGCSREGSVWKDATSENTIEAYETFLFSYPDGEHRDSALERIETLRLESAEESHSLEEYARFLSDYPESTHQVEVATRLDSLVAAHLTQSFLAVFMAVRPGENILAAPSVDHSGYDKARKSLDDVLKTLPEHVVAANNRAVLAVEEGDFERARSLFDRAAAIAEDDQVDEVALRIGIGSADNQWLSSFYMLQPADLVIEMFSFAKRKDRPERRRNPLTVTFDLLTPGAAQVTSLKASPCTHVVVDETKPTYLLKGEIENNIRALDALVDPSARKRCR